MPRNGITSERNTSKLIKDFIFKIYWEQIVLPINFIIFHIKFSILKVHKRSNQSLIRPSARTIDTNEHIRIIEKGRENMCEFVRIVPDECLIDLSEKVYCVSKRI